MTSFRNGYLEKSKNHFFSRKKNDNLGLNIPFKLYTPFMLLPTAPYSNGAVKLSGMLVTGASTQE